MLLIEGAEENTRKKSTEIALGTNDQLVKTCCPEEEAFNVITKSCISFANAGLYNVAKSSLLYPYYGNWKHRKTPRISHLKPQCDFKTYQLNPIARKIALKNDQIETSTHNVSYIKFDYYSNYCIDIAVNTLFLRDGSSFVGVGSITCLPQHNRIESYIRLCCPLLKRFDQELGKCRSLYEDEKDVDVYTILDNVPIVKMSKETVEIKKQVDVITFLYGSPDCIPNQVNKIGREKLILFDTGNIKVRNNVLDQSEYCISNIQLNSSTSNYDAVIQYCEYPGWNIVWYTYIEPTMYVISNVFLLALFIYVMLEKGNRLFGAMMMAVIFNLFFCYLAIAVAKLWGREQYIRSPTLCLLDAIFIQFTYLSVMYWLNAMCFDVWSNFHHMKAPKRISEVGGKLNGFKHPKFKKYALYGWGIPLCVTTVTLIMQLLPSEYTEGYVTPGIGETSCSLRSGMAKFYYQFFIAGIALLSTVVLFGLFVWNLCCGVWASQTGDPVVR